MSTPKHIKTLKVRVRDKHAPLLREMSREVNEVWNYCNDLSYRMIRERHHWPTGYDLHPYLAGASCCFKHINADVIARVRDTYAKSRKQACRSRLRWRRSFRGDDRHSLGWIPFNGVSVRWKHGQIKFAGHFFKVWDSYGLSQYDFRAGAFVEDARGRWYFTVAVKVEKSEGNPDGKPVGIDPGLADVATTSDGRKCPSRRYREMESHIGKAQRHARGKGNTRAQQRVKSLHAKVFNRRKHDAHVFSRCVVNNTSAVYMGNWKPPTSGKSRWAKSARDGALSSLKGMLKYKCEHAGISYIEVNEANSSQTCSSCGAIHGSPRGRAGLGVRQWVCNGCGVSHDRDVNAAINILLAGAGHRPH